MKTYATITGPNGKVKLTFGIYGLKNFCKRLGCEPSILSVLPAFSGGTRLEAISEIIRSGMEQAAAEQNQPVTITDFEACEVLEASTEAEGEAVMKSFLSSIVGENYDEWFKRLQKDSETEDTSEAEGKKKAEPGTKSNPKPTEK